MDIRFFGINNVDDPSALQQGDLVGAMNVDIAKKTNSGIVTGTALRRPGYTRISTAAQHSLFSDDISLYCVKGGVLCRDDQPIMALSSDGPMSYSLCDNGWAVFTNGVDIGYIEGGTPHLFGEPIKSYLDETGTEVQTFKEKLPAGQFIAFVWGMICTLVAAGDETWLIHTDPWDFDGYNTSENFLRWKGPPTMLIAVNNGVWVGAGSRISYVTFGEQGSEVPCAEYAAIPGTAQTVAVKKTGFNNILSGEICAVFATEQGVCVGGNDGIFINLSEGKVALPEASQGAAIVKEEDGRVTLICNLLSENDSAYNPRSNRPLSMDN